MKGDRMANTKVDPYQDPAYHPPQHALRPSAETMTTDPPHVAPETHACIEAEDSGQIKKFVQCQVEDMLKLTHEQAEADKH